MDYGFIRNTCFMEKDGVSGGARIRNTKNMIRLHHRCGRRNARTCQEALESGIERRKNDRCNLGVNIRSLIIRIPITPFGHSS